MANKYTKENIIESIQRFHKENNKVPRNRDFGSNVNYPSATTVEKYFGSWNNAIEAAGFTVISNTKSKIIRREWTKRQILEAIRKFYIINKNIPSAKDFRGNSNYPSGVTVQNHFGSWNKGIEAAGFVPKTQNKRYKDCSKEGCIEAIQRFYKENNRSPTYNDFIKNPNYPSNTTVARCFGSWVNALIAANVKLNTYKGYGQPTSAKDTHIYRSQAEAYFVDNFLFEKYNYQIEPRYPNNINKYYDWYIPELNLYIELDGGLRPETTKEKIILNKQLGRDCLFIKVKSIYNKKKLEDFK